MIDQWCLHSCILPDGVGGDVEDAVLAGDGDVDHRLHRGAVEVVVVLWSVRGFISQFLVAVGSDLNLILSKLSRIQSQIRLNLVKSDKSDRI